jgi:hypothetical protein
MVEITVSILLQLIQTIGILVGIIYYITIMRNQQRTRELTLKAQEHATETRQTQIFMQLYQDINSETFHRALMEIVNLEIDDYDDYLQKYDSRVNPNHYAKRAHIWGSFNTTGELLRQGIIEPDLVHRLQLGQLVTIVWEKWEHIIRELRERENVPEVWEGFEYLYDEMKRYRIERGLPDYTYEKFSSVQPSASM